MVEFVPTVDETAATSEPPTGGDAVADEDATLPMAL
jgi:hypothetical protein